MSQRSDASAAPQQEPSEEQKVRTLVRDMYATPGGRAMLDWLFERSDGAWEDVARRLNERPEVDEMTRQEHRAQLKRELRERSPHVTDEEWAEWGL